MSSQATTTLNLEKLLLTESERLKNCQSDEGFFQRLATISIPTLTELKNIGEIVEIWEQGLNDSQLVKDVVSDLIIFLQWHWDLAIKLNHRHLRSLVWSVVRKIRGPIVYINWSRSLLDQISPIIDEILAIDIGAYERPSLHQFRELQKLNILKTFQVNQDCDPKYLWQSLRLVSSCWERRHHRASSRKWNKPKGSFSQVVLQAYNQTNQFFHDVVSEELRLLDKEKELRFFKRAKYQTIFDRLVTELQLLIARQNVGILRKKDPNMEASLKNKTRIPAEDSDEKSFCYWYKEWKKNTSSFPPYKRTQQIAIKAFKAQPQIKLREKYEDSTYLRWMTGHNNRSKSRK